MSSNADGKYAKEAEAFASIMKELAPEVKLDYSPKSLQSLDEFVSKRFEPPGSRYAGDALMVGMGCYVGEVIVRNVGGHWSKSGKPEINEVASIQAIFPIQKVVKRFRNGQADSLAFYYATILKYANNK